MFAFFYHFDRSGRFVDCTFVDETSPGSPREIGHVSFTPTQWFDFQRALGLNPQIRLVKDGRYAVTRGPAASNELTGLPGNNVMPARHPVKADR